MKESKVKKIIKKLYKKRLEMLFSKGVMEGKITGFDEEIYDKMDGTVIACLPVSLYIKYSNTENINIGVTNNFICSHILSLTGNNVEKITFGHQSYKKWKSIVNPKIKNTDIILIFLIFIVIITNIIS